MTIIPAEMSSVSPSQPTLIWDLLPEAGYGGNRCYQAVHRHVDRLIKAASWGDTDSDRIPGTGTHDVSLHGSTTATCKARDSSLSKYVLGKIEWNLFN